MATWNGVPIPEPPQIKIPDSIPQNFNWNSYLSDPKGTFTKFKGAREVNRLNWKGYKTTTNTIKKTILSSPSKKFISAAGKQIRSTKQAADTARKVQDAFFKKMPGGGTPKNAGIAGGSLLNIVIQGGLAVAVIQNTLIQNFINDTVDRQFLTLNNDLSKNLTLLTTLNSKVKNLDAKLNKFNERISRELDTSNKDYIRLNNQTGTIAKTTAEAKKQANDALYETRQGRTILESKISEAKKQSNDALYETRTTKQNVEKQITGVRASLEAKIQQVNSQISRFNNSANEAFQKAIATTVLKVQSDLAITKAQVNTIRQNPSINASEINANAVAAAKAEARIAQSQVSALQGVVAALGDQLAGALALGGAAINGVSNLASSVATANNTANAALNEAKKNSGIAPLQQSNLSKEFDKRQADFERLSTMTADERFEEFKRENNKALGIRDLQQSNLSKEFDKRQANFERLSTMTADQRFEEFQRTNRESLGLLEKDLGQTKKEIESNKATITKIDTKLGEQAKVNEQALPKLDQIVGILGLIPARAAAAIRPDIPTIPQIETAAATGTCRTTQPGGCMNKALNDNAANITNNNNTNAANILGAVNAVGQGADLALLNVINTKLGEQLPGGIGGKLSRFADWMHLDRVLNILIFAATVHNALMLSNDIGQTLLGAINNVLTLIGLKKEDGSSFDLGSVISGSIENLIKSAIGADNYTNLREAWAKANRIYQASTNILNSFQSLTSTVLSGLELVAGQTGKIGNALRASGEVLESAYQWMNPQPKINRVTNFLEKLQNGASTIQQVTQVPLDTINAITELQTANTEFIKAIKEDDKPENKGATVEEPAKLAEEKALAKELSKGLELLGIDLEADED